MNWLSAVWRSRTCATPAGPVPSAPSSSAPRASLRRASGLPSCFCGLLGHAALGRHDRDLLLGLEVAPHQDQPRPGQGAVQPLDALLELLVVQVRRASAARPEAAGGGTTVAPAPFGTLGRGCRGDGGRRSGRGRSRRLGLRRRRAGAGRGCRAGVRRGGWRRRLLPHLELAPLDLHERLERLLHPLRGSRRSGRGWGRPSDRRRSARPAGGGPRRSSRAAARRGPSRPRAACTSSISARSRGLLTCFLPFFLSSALRVVPTSCRARTALRRFSARMSARAVAGP